MCIDHIVYIRCVGHVGHIDYEAGVVPSSRRPGLRLTPSSEPLDTLFSVLDNHLTGHVKDFRTKLVHISTKLVARTGGK